MTKSIIVVTICYKLLCHSSRFLISNFLASTDINVFGRTYLFAMLLLIGLALCLHPGCFCLACHLRMIVIPFNMSTMLEPFSKGMQTNKVQMPFLRFQVIFVGFQLSGDNYEVDGSVTDAISNFSTLTNQ